MSMSPTERIEAIKMIHNLYNLLGTKGGLAGVVLTEDAYNLTKRLFSDIAIPFRPSELDLDPAMESSFVVDGMLIMKGSKLQ